ncbi:DUF2203 domain-containing protein [bacterium]|nr:DUF2203 domain-containing protein [bacterium]
MGRKYYTLDEANEALPNVKNMAAKIRRAESVRQARQEEHARVMQAIAQNGGDFSAEKFLRLAQSLERSTRQLQRLMDNLQSSFGCEIKGLQPLLVDFYSKRAGQDIYLCWQEGEPEITHWHNLNAGFAGRQPL